MAKTENEHNGSSEKISPKRTIRVDRDLRAHCDFQEAVSLCLCVLIRVTGRDAAGKNYESIDSINISIIQYHSLKDYPKCQEYRSITLRHMTTSRKHLIYYQGI